jgi:hypothetical protein
MSLRDRLGKINAGSVPPEPNPAMMPSTSTQPVNKMAQSGGTMSAAGSSSLSSGSQNTSASSSSAANNAPIAPALKAGKNERLEDLKHQIHGQLVDNLEVNTSSDKNWEDVTAAANTFLEQF